MVLNGCPHYDEVLENLIERPNFLRDPVIPVAWVPILSVSMIFVKIVRVRLLFIGLYWLSPEGIGALYVHLCNHKRPVLIGDIEMLFEFSLVKAKGKRWH